MDIFTASVPNWVSFLLIPVFPLTVLWISQMAKKAAIQAQVSASKSANLQWGIIGFYSLFLLYTAVLSFKGILSENTLPPKILLYATVPLMLFLLGFVLNTKLYRKVLENTPLPLLIRLHIFRLVGIVFILAYWYHALPARFAFIAGMGDIATAMLSIPVAYWIVTKKPWSIKAAYAWNIFGLWDIISVLVTAILTTKDSIDNHTQGLIEITNFPFVWIPAFAPATIIFLHITVFKKLTIYRKTIL